MNMEFIKKHKKKIILGGTILVAVATGVVLGKKLESLKYAGKDVISWVPKGVTATLEEAKALLDLNAGNESIFALVKYGSIIKPVTLNGTRALMKFPEI